MPNPRAVQFLFDHHAWAGDHSRSVDAFTLRRVLRDVPTLAPDAGSTRGALLALLAEANARLGRHAEALDAARAAAREDPDHPQYHVAVAAELLALGRPRDACEALDVAHEAAKRVTGRGRETWLQLHAYRAEALDRVGDRARARESYEAASRLADPASTSDLALLASQAAVCGWPLAAVEYVLRWVAALGVSPIERERTVYATLTGAPEAVKARIAELPALAAVVHARILSDDERRPSGFHAALDRAPAESSATRARRLTPGR